MTPTKLLSLFLALCAFAAPALAQTADNAQVMDRMDHLERDLMMLQKQVSQGPTPSGGGNAVSVPPSDAASLEVRLSAIEDELRHLRGGIEENENQVHKLSATLEKLQQDTEFRFNELNKTPPGVPLGAIAPAPAPAPVAAPAAPTAAATGTGTTIVDDGNKIDFATPREHYNYAFRLLNQTQYPEAAASFEAFIKKYPKDSLIGNAWYWEGETFYIRRDYIKAADDFRQGFEAAPEGPKAPDNLYKLGLSLNAMNRDKEACIVLQQVVTKFKKGADSVAQKADQEIKRIGCKATSGQ